MQTVEELIEQFNKDIDQISLNFISCFNLCYSEEASNLCDPLLRWLDFVNRYIPPVPREICLSNKFPIELCSDAKSGLNTLIQIIQKGGDINPYQSKGLTLHNDTSSRKKQKRTDLLWADWGIHHLHLTDIPISPKSYFSDRSDKSKPHWLLFCRVYNNVILFIDIKNHNETDLFSDTNLIKTLAESWPEIVKPYQLNIDSMFPSHFSSNEIAALRKAGLTSTITVNNQVYMPPGMGITSAATSNLIGIQSMNIHGHARKLAEIVHKPSNQFKTESSTSGITSPEYCISLAPQGLSVYEKNQDKAFVLPRETGSFLAELHDLIAPVWAIDYLISNS